MDIRKSKIVITGASSGFGEATARLLAKRWPECTLFLTGRRKEKLEAIAAELGPRARTFAFDIRDRAATESFAREAGEVQVLVNNAGLAAGLDAFQEAKVEDWEQMIDTNLKGLLYITRALLPGMIARKEGHIVNLGSIAGHVMYPKGHVYAATKAAVKALNEGLRLDLLGTNVRVTSIDPGMAETEFSVVRFKGDQAKADAVYKGMRPLTGEDIAECILWSLERPAHVNIQDMVVMPTDQASPRDVARSL